MSASRPPDAPDGGTHTANPYAAPTASLDAAGLGAVVPPAANGYKSATGLAKAIAALMLVDVLIQLVLAVNAFMTIGVIREIEAGRVARTALQSVVVRFGGLGGLAFLTLIAIIILWCLFMARANRNARAFGSPMSMTPGWAAGWFFVPIAFWWKPYEAMKEIWQGSDPDPSVHPWQSRVSSLLPWWWCAYLLRNLSGIANQFIGKGNDHLRNLVEICQAELVLMWPSIAAALLAAAVVLAVARRQDQRQSRQPSGAPLPAPAF